MKQTEKTNLELCAFCGSTEVEIRYDSCDDYWLVCKGCGKARRKVTFI